MAAKYGTATTPGMWMVHITRKIENPETGFERIQYLFIGRVWQVGQLFAIQAPEESDRRKADYAHRGTAVTALKRHATLKDRTRDIMWR